MSTYLLLRDNKQSGPFSLDEIIAKGFKKYDLVWVEGKSAAWRYPGEIEEFKAIAPVVEEQPFDRFFKKPAEEQKINKNLPDATEKKEFEKGKSGNRQVVVEIGDKKVFAAMPSLNAKTGSGVQKPEIKPFLQKETPRQVLEQNESNYPAATEENAFQYASFQDSASVRQYDFRKKASKNYGRYVQPLLMVILVLALLGGGIFIGMAINRNTTKTLALEKNREEPAARNDQQGSNDISIPVSNSLPAENNSPGNSRQIQHEALVSDLSVSSKSQPVHGQSAGNPEEAVNKKIIKKKQKPATEPVNSLIKNNNTPDSTASSIPMQRQSVHRSDLNNEKVSLKANIAELVTVSANKYNVGTFGGISEVQLTVNNRSIYPLDLVMVEVQYVQANKKIFKTENVYYHNIRPGESIMQEAPRSPRGVKIQYRVALINSKEPSISYSGI